MTKKPDDWMPLRIAEYLADTQHLTRDQHGAYLLLLMAYWRRGEALLDDDGQLAAIAKASASEWRKIKPIIAPFFRREDGRWYQKRCEAELAAARALVEQRSVAGKASAAVRDRQRGGNGEATGVEREVQRESNGGADLSTKNQEPLAAAVARAKDEEEFKELATLLAFDGNDFKNWLEFIAMKTQHALDFVAHIRPAAQHHKSVGKMGKTLAYIRPKAIEIRDQLGIVATMPVLFEDCDDGRWHERLKFWVAHPEFDEETRWPKRWGPVWTDPANKVPPNILVKFKTKLNGSGNAHAEQV